MPFALNAIIKQFKYFAVFSLVVTNCVSCARGRRRKIQISAEIPNEEILGLPKIKYEGWVDPCFYFSMEELLEVWEKSRVQFPQGSRALMGLFINKCFTSPTSWDKRNADKNRFPFINIEGNHHNLRDKVAKSVSKAIKGQLLLNPPKCLVSVNYIYGERKHELHRPFLGLGVYALSHSVKAYWVRKPVVMTGYWYDLTATTITDVFAHGTTLATNSTVYQFPQGLMKPDLTVFLNTREEAIVSWEDMSVKDQRDAAWQSRYTESFLGLPHAEIHQMQWTSSENVTQSILHLLQEKLGQSFNFTIKLG